MDYLLILGGLKFKDACVIAYDAVKYCLDVLDSLGPLCAYEAATVLLEQISMNLFTINEYLFCLS